MPPEQPGQSHWNEHVDEARLQFLHDEGLEVLKLYTAIRSDQTRLMLRDLMRAIAESQSAAADGDGAAQRF